MHPNDAPWHSTAEVTPAHEPPGSASQYTRAGLAIGTRLLAIITIIRFGGPMLEFLNQVPGWLVAALMALAVIAMAALVFVHTLKACWPTDSAHQKELLEKILLSGPTRRGRATHLSLGRGRVRGRAHR